MHFILALLCVLCLGYTRTGGAFYITPTPACEDRLWNCEDFMDNNMNACSGIFRVWASENCINTCGLCQGTPKPTPICLDNIKDCAAFGKDVCTSVWRGWAQSHCAKFCNLC